MRKTDQQRLIKDLESYTVKMNREEQELFDMLRKREKDDEELDSLAVQKLQALHDKFLPHRSKQDLEELWNKLTSQRKP
jgi:site-specific recombinase